MKADDSVQKRLIRGVGAQAASQATRSLVQVVNVPLLIHFWGVGLYGEWLILSAVPAYFAMSDMGFGDVAGNEMTIRVAEGDVPGAIEVFQSVWTLTTALCGLAVLAGVLVASMGPLARWLNLSILGDGTAAAVLSLGLVLVLVSQQGGLIAAVLRAQKLFAEATFIGNLLYLAESVAFIVAVALGASPVGAALVLLGARIVSTVMLWLYATRSTPWLVLGVRHVRIDTIRRLFRPAIAFLAFPLGNALSIQGMVLVVGRILDPTAVVVFTTVRTVTNAAKQAMGILKNAVWPEISIAYGRGNLGVMRELHRRACQSTLLLTLAPTVILFFAGPFIIRVWTGGSVAVQVTFLRWMLLVILANSLWFTSSVVPTAINRHVRLATVFLVTTVLSLGAALVLLPRLGLTGVALALLVVDAGMVGYVLPTSLRLVDDRPADFFASLLDPSKLWRGLRLRRAV